MRIFQHFERLEKRFEDKEQLLKVEVVMRPANGVKVAFWEGREAKVWKGEKA